MKLLFENNNIGLSVFINTYNIIFIYYLGGMGYQIDIPFQWVQNNVHEWQQFKHDYLTENNKKEIKKWVDNRAFW